MKDTCHYLFVYGTLLNEANEFGSYLKKNCQFFSEGSFRGLLYDLGEYPGAVRSSLKDACIHGAIYYMNHWIAILKILDKYEGFGENELKPNLFTREMVEIKTASEQVACWVYLYNRPVKGLKPIRSGRYL